MKIDNENMLESILENIHNLDEIKLEDIPDIPLYMDQVTTFMEENLGKSKRYDNDKILTKTMINNYTKNKLLPPPTKKKYNKEHLMLLIFIYYFKHILSITDIQKIIEPLSNSFGKSKSIDINKVYEEIVSIVKNNTSTTKEDIKIAYDLSKNSFKNETKQKDYLQLLAYVSLLSYDVYVKMAVIESIIDTIPPQKK